MVEPRDPNPLLQPRAIGILWDVWVNRITVCSQRMKPRGAAQNALAYRFCCTYGCDVVDSGFLFLLLQSCFPRARFICFHSAFGNRKLYGRHYSFSSATL